MIHFDQARPRVACFHKTLPAGTWEQLYPCAIAELDHAQLPGRILDARHAILDRAEEILTRPSGDEPRALNNAFRTLRTLEEVMAKENQPHKGDSLDDHLRWETKEAGLFRPAGVRCLSSGSNFAGLQSFFDD
jgi:hypothetical protein